MGKITHGMSKTRLYRIWRKMNHRCLPNGSYFKYGRRVCFEWSFDCQNGFGNFRDWSFDNGYSDDLEIDRINNDGDYDPQNCRWTTRAVQALNTKNNVRYAYKDEYKTLSEFSREYGISRDVLQKRVSRYGWSIQKAIETPVQNGNTYSFNGEIHTLKEWAEIAGVPKQTLKSRLNYGYSFADAITGHMRVKSGKGVLSG